MCVCMLNNGCNKTFKHASLKEVNICHAISLYGSGKRLKRKDPLRLFTTTSKNLWSEKTPATMGREIKFMYTWGRGGAGNPVYAH